MLTTISGKGEPNLPQPKRLIKLVNNDKILVAVIFSVAIIKQAKGMTFAGIVAPIETKQQSAITSGNLVE